MAQARATVDHETIRRWVETRGGSPAHVKGSGSRDDPGILRIDFPGFSGHGSLEKISWKKFFDAFDRNRLAFLYQDSPKSRFSKLVSRESVDVNGSGSRRGNGRRAQARSGNGRRARGDGRQQARRAAARAATIDAIDLLTQQHREVEELFEKLESARGSRPQRTFQQLAAALAAHTQLEETIFYPAVFGDDNEELLRESVEEHLVAKRLIADLMDMEPGDPQFAGKLAVLKEVVMHHVEKEEDELFPQVRKEETEDLQVLGGTMQRRYRELMQAQPMKTIPRQIREANVHF